MLQGTNAYEVQKVERLGERGMEAFLTLQLCF